MIRRGSWRRPTAPLAPGFVQANLTVLPEAFAADFESYCRTNPRTLPILEVTEPGSPVPERTAPDGDLRTDLPRYRVFRDGHFVCEVDDLRQQWSPDAVSFLTGCSFTFDALLVAEGIPVRHIELSRNVPMFVTHRCTQPVGIFSGQLVVSMRPIRRVDLDRVIDLTRRLPDAHGAPVHIGDPMALGIRNLDRPDAGDPVPVRADEVPCFWACGVTGQATAEGKPIPWMIAHAPGHMFITDLTLEQMLADSHDHDAAPSVR